MTVNQTTIDLIKHFEGIRAEAYKDSAGIWTIGYGHTDGVTAATPPCTPEQAKDWLEDDIEEAENDVCDFTAKHNISLNQNQYGALVSLVYNMGIRPLLGTLGTALTANMFSTAADCFQKWVFIHDANGNAVQLAGLVARRDAEKALFLTPVQNKSAIL